MPLRTSNTFKGGSGRGGADLSLVIRTQRNRMEFHHGKFRWDIRKRFFTETVVHHWNRLSMELVTAQSPSEFKEHLDNAFSLMVKL